MNKKQSNTNSEKTIRVTEKSKFFTVNQETLDTPVLVERSVSGKNFINYGKDNSFPDQIWDLYLQSAILEACVNGTSDYAMGGGVETHGDAIINNEQETLNDLVRRIIFDYVLFGGFAIQGIRNIRMNRIDLYWLDMRKVRLSADGKFAYYSEKWNVYGCKSIKYELYNPLKQQDNFIFYFKGHISRDFYPIPRFIGALKSVATDAEVSNYHFRSINNNFTPSTLISFNNGAPSEEEKEEIERSIKKKFTGTDNANKFIISFNNSKENETTISRLDSGNEDQKYQSLSKDVMSKIFISFRATPALFGLNPENNGFSKQEFLESFELYNKTVVQPIQADIEKPLSKLLGFDVKIIPFALDENQITTQTTAEQ